MKTVFNHSMLCHVWAQASQSNGRASDGRMFFNDSKLYSYGSHFPIGKIMPDRVALLNADSYSVSTGKHQSYARGAVSNRRILYIPGLTQLERTGALDTGGKLNSLTKAEKVKRLKAWLSGLHKSSGAWFAEHEGGKDYKDSAAVYLLQFAGLNARDAAKTWERIRAQSIQTITKEKAAKAKAAFNESLAYAAMVAKRDNAPADASANFARRNDRELYLDSVKLHHAHLAAKAANRVKQSAAVWEVLKIVRAELKRRKDNAAIIAANQARKQWCHTLRDRLGDIQDAANNGAMIDPAHLRQTIRLATDLMGSSSNRIFPKLIPLIGGMHDALPGLEFAWEQEQKRSQAEKLAEWLAGRSMRGGSFYLEGATYLRAVRVERDESGRIIGGVLETSRGAEVPLVHAVKAFKFLKLMREQHLKRVPDTGFGPVEYQNASCIVWRRNGHSIRVGHFTVDSVRADGGFTAGCHSIEWEQVERIARELGVFDLPPDNSAVESSNSVAA